MKCLLQTEALLGGFHKSDFIPWSSAGNCVHTQATYHRDQLENAKLGPSAFEKGNTSKSLLCKLSCEVFIAN